MITSFNKLSREEASTQMNNWIMSEGKELPSLSGDYAAIRQSIEEIFQMASTEVPKLRSYEFDVTFGILLYEYLNAQIWFSKRLSADDGFWRYMSIMIVPHLYAKRWDYNNADHYWKKGIRIWFKTLWWYVYLGWESDSESTKTKLLDSRYSTDTILHLVERPSNKGMNIDLYRKIFEIYNKLDKDTLKQLKKTVSNAGGVFGSMMCLNTTHTVVIEPSLYENGLDGYVRSLFVELGADEDSIKR